MSRRGEWARAGFTMVEVMVAVIMVAILAAAAVPQYRKTMERTYWRSAQDALRTIYAGEQVYEAANGTYVNGATCGTPWRCIYMDNPADPSIPVAYTFSGISATTFTATATRKAGQFMTITQASNQVNTASWPYP